MHIIRNIIYTVTCYS